jgi:hypothetical protein
MARPSPTAAFALLLLSTVALPARAEEAVPQAATQPVAEDETQTTGALGEKRVAPFRLTSVLAGQPVADTPVFRPLAVDANDLHFEGEMGIVDLPVYVRSDEISEKARLRLRYLSAVTVMPEASRLIVTVNDRAIAELMLDAATDANTVEIEVPAGLLRSGYNGVRLSLQQRHRVDCSIEAANELWTKIDPEVSGFLLTSKADQISALDDLTGLVPATDGTTPINVVMPAGADIAALDQALRAAQAVAIRADIQRPRIHFLREASQSAGLTLYVGSPATLRGMGVEETVARDPGLHLSGRAATARLVIVGNKPADIDTLIRTLAEDAGGVQRTGTPEGLRAYETRRGIPVGAENEIKLSAYGLATQEFSGRLFQTSFNIVLPNDFYPADNGKATLYLDGEYVAGLLPSNEALVRINGAVVGASRLAKSSGDVFSRRAIEVSLRSLRPGHNRVTLEIRGATEDDRDCNPLSLIDSPRRLTVASSTALAIPRFARADHRPNLGATAATGFPYATDKPVTLFMPRADMAALSAAGTFLARTAVSAGQPIATRISARAPDDASAPALIVGGIGELPDWVLSQFNINPAMLPKTWQSARRKGGSASAADAPQPAAVPVRVASVSAAVLRPGTASDSAAPAKAAEEKPGEQAAQTPLVDRMLGGFSRFLQKNIGFRPEQLDFLNRGRPVVTASASTTLVLAETEGKAGTQPWLLLTGPDTATLQRDLPNLVAPSTWQQIGGGMAAYDAATRSVDLFPGSSHYRVRMTDRSMGNLTLFAAGWLSNHIHYYILVVLSACLVFGIVSRKLLNRVGQQP